MNGFAPGLFDRLMDEPLPAGAGGALARLSIEQLKDSVARDLEALLNTRMALPARTLDAYPECRDSILGYGLVDLAGFCLSSGDDRAAIEASLKGAIERHEPRLHNVSAALELEAGSVNRVSFIINATLKVAQATEPVNFNAVLQPSSLHYSISKAARSAHA